MTIWKFPLEVTDVQDVALPAFAEIISAQNQGGTLFLWAIVDPDHKLLDRRIHILGTGNPVPTVPSRKRLRFIDTVQMGMFVWHVFEETWER